MRVELPVSGGWIDIAERWKGSLHGRMAGAVMVETTDGKVLLPGDIGHRQTLAFLKEQITDWSFATEKGIPIPKTPGPGGQDRTDVIEEVLEGNAEADDLTFLFEAVQPLVLRVLGRSRPNPPSTPAISASSSPS